MVEVKNANKVGNYCTERNRGGGREGFGAPECTDGPLTLFTAERRNSTSGEVIAQIRRYFCPEHTARAVRRGQTPS